MCSFEGFLLGWQRWNVAASIHDQLEILQRAAEEKGRGELFAQALDKVGPWAKNQRLSDNDSPPKRI